MIEQPILNIQHGIWLDADWLAKAGLGQHIKVLVQPGEIRIRPAQDIAENSANMEEGWQIFLTLEAGALPGKDTDVSVNHDRYLYGREQ